MSLIEAIRADAAKLLQEGQVKMVLGYRARYDRRLPLLITKGDQVSALVYDEACWQNLPTYIRKSEVRSAMPVAIVCRPEGIRSLLVLASEAQITDDAVRVLAVVGGEYRGAMDLPAAAQLIKDLPPAPVAPEIARKLDELAALSANDRAAFWRDALAPCTRCYACRASCPVCYCQNCVVERNTPQIVSTTAAPHGNFAWNIVRAFHQAGRCTLCGACQTACPQNLPLMLLNAWIERQVREEFAFVSGSGLDAKPFIGSWSPNDDDKFIR
ncbi:MAG: 4Fe-4S dicluster domain-containing protein [Planctomycetota bacterium]|jgi:ferredoxin